MNMSSEDIKGLDLDKQKTYLEEMIESCYTYGGCEVGGHGFDKYIKKYMKPLGEDLFWSIYNAKVLDLETNYKIIPHVYEDSEGVTYNSLVKVVQ